MQINLTTEEVKALREWIADDDEPAPVVLSVGDGHAGFGLYVWTEDYPEEGAVFIKPLTGAQPAPAAPIDVVLHCPKCGHQHIDAPDPAPQFASPDDVWTNPPHKSHLCHGCGHIWRPADVPTNGVAAVQTKGANDSPLAAPAAQPADSAMLRDLDAALRSAASDYKAQGAYKDAGYFIDLADRARALTAASKERSKTHDA